MKNTSSDNKLILVKDYDGQTTVRYRKQGDSHWNSLYLNETDIDVIIDAILKVVK